MNPKQRKAAESYKLPYVLNTDRPNGTVSVVFDEPVAVAGEDYTAGDSFQHVTCHVWITPDGAVHLTDPDSDNSLTRELHMNPTGDTTMRNLPAALFTPTNFNTDPALRALDGALLDLLQYALLRLRG